MWGRLFHFTSNHVRVFQKFSIRREFSEMANDSWWQMAKEVVPKLSDSKRHKGQSGRIGVVGGSLEYTGAPYFAAISALKVGADLSHVFCTKEAAPVIKSYSPELIVHPLLDSKENLQEIKEWLNRIHVLIIGPGLGRNEKTLELVKEIIIFCKDNRKPLIIDADGLYLITQNIELIQDYPLPGVILTPNKVEYGRLYDIIKTNDCDNEDSIDYGKLGKNVLVLRKGQTDQTFCKDDRAKWSNDIGGSGRRCGGQGDLLSGAIATFFHWSLSYQTTTTMTQAGIATFAASTLTRLCNEKAFSVKGRSMLCSDMIDKIHDVFEEKYESK